MRKNALKDQSFDFAVRIVGLYKILVAEKQEYVLSKQVLRSGTAIGALYREAEQAESKADFIHKLSIAQKECNETLYWLQLLNATNYIDGEAYDILNRDATALIKIITSIILKTKKNLL